MILSLLKEAFWPPSKRTWWVYAVWVLVASAIALNYTGHRVSTFISIGVLCAISFWQDRKIQKQIKEAEEARHRKEASKVLAK